MLQTLQRMGPVFGAASTDVVEFNIGLWHHKKEGEYGGLVQVRPCGGRGGAERCRLWASGRALPGGHADAAACLRARPRPGAPVRGWEPAGARLAGSERPLPASNDARKQALADNYAANRSAGPALVWRDNSPQHFDIENGARGGGGGAGAGLPRGVAGCARPRLSCSAGARDPFNPPQPHPHLAPGAGEFPHPDEAQKLIWDAGKGGRCVPMQVGRAAGRAVGGQGRALGPARHAAPRSAAPPAARHLALQVEFTLPALPGAVHVSCPAALGVIKADPPSLPALPTCNRRAWSCSRTARSPAATSTWRAAAGATSWCVGGLVGCRR